MKAVLYKKGGRDNAIFTDVPDPVCGPEDVLIRVYASAICKPADFDQLALPGCPGSVRQGGSHHVSI